MPAPDSTNMARHIVAAICFARFILNENTVNIAIIANKLIQNTIMLSDLIFAFMPEAAVSYESVFGKISNILHSGYMLSSERLYISPVKRLVIGEKTNEQIIKIRYAAAVFFIVEHKRPISMAMIFAKKKYKIDILAQCKK